ncbi:hypothetical protein E2R23_14845 [Burkholderia pseudomallei]|nr:hypothetical protein EXY72_14830 [Burkholderia pseudomallei]QBL78890.1 hypothetical protein EYA82_14745 [Burkholderia pseudomallei]QBP56019.1 hypothetical protein E2R23_14845 [Burkholderia pseudomallei]
MAWRVGGVRVRTSEYWCDRLRAVEVSQAKRAASRCVVEARNLRCAMCDMPRATCEMRPTACGVRRVTRNAPCPMRLMRPMRGEAIDASPAARLWTSCCRRGGASTGRRRRHGERSRPTPPRARFSRPPSSAAASGRYG